MEAQEKKHRREWGDGLFDTRPSVPGYPDEEAGICCMVAMLLIFITVVGGSIGLCCWMAENTLPGGSLNP